MAEWTLCADLKVYARPRTAAKPPGPNDRFPFPL